MRSIRKQGRQHSYRLLIVLVGCVAIFVILFLASWMNTRCWNSSQSCAEQDDFQR
jgi:hypothetical protein